MTTKQAVQVISAGQAVMGSQSVWRPGDQDLVASAIAPGLAGHRDALTAFAAICRHARLDPFRREVYAWMDKGKLVVHIGVEGWRVLASRTGEYAGQEGPEWCGPDGKWLDVWLDEKKPPAAARVGIRRKDSLGTTWSTVTMKEFGRALPIWKEKPAHMLAIAAERHALRRACPGADSEALAVVKQYAPAAAVVEEEPPPEVLAAAVDTEPSGAATTTSGGEEGDVQATASPSEEQEGGEGDGQVFPREAGPSLPSSVNDAAFIDWWMELDEAREAATLSLRDLAILVKPKPWNGANALAYATEHGLDPRGVITAAQKVRE
jgi:hypothetical protein